MFVKSYLSRYDVAPGGARLADEERGAAKRRGRGRGRRNKIITSPTTRQVLPPKTVQNRQ